MRAPVARRMQLLSGAVAGPSAAQKDADTRKGIAYECPMVSKDALETERLALAKTTWRDAVFVLRLIGNASVRRYLGGAVPVRRRLAVFRAYLDTGPHEMVWTVRLRNSASPLGLISVTRHKDGREFELSYQFHPNAWGRGHAFEAASAVLRFVRKERGLRRVIAETQAANVASCRLLGRLGMTEQRRLQRYGAEQVVYVADL